MGAAVWLVSAYLGDMFATAAIVPRFTALAAVVGVGLLVYAAATLATGALEIRQLRTLLRRGSAA
jgi:putative peptidoglycan lipid II flippase